MCFIILTSTNNNYSHLICKNPNTKIILKKIKNGISSGYYQNGSYVVRFIDDIDGSSYKEDKSKKFSCLQYSSPLIMCSIITEYFNTALNKTNDNDIIAKQSIEMTQIYLNKRAVNFLHSMDQFIDNLTVDIKHINSGIHKITISGEMTLQTFLKYCYFIGIICGIMTTGHMMEQSCGDKIMDIVIDLNMPFYIRYLIKNMFNYTEFPSVRKMLAMSATNKIVLYGGTTQQQRYDFISAQINTDTHIIDFGCGEGYYVKKIIPKLNKNNKYFALDIDNIHEKHITEIKNKTQFDGLYFFSDYEVLLEKIKLIDNGIFTIIMTEVLEHIEQEKLIKILKSLIANINFVKIVLTTPNVKFNVNFGNKGYRHKDHVHEYTKEELVQLFDGICENNIKYRYYSIGDSVNGECITHALVINNCDAFNNIKLDTNNTNNQQKPKVKQLSKQQKKISLRMQYCVGDKINYISGTMTPVPSNKYTKNDNLEDLYEGLKLLAKTEENTTYCIQPKYMGCRCNIYLFKDVNLCYGVSRNGHKINKNLDLTSIYNKLHTRLADYMETNNIKLMIIDGELLPWTFLSGNLIETDFLSYGVCMKEEAELIKKYNFDEMFHSINSQINGTEYLQDRETMSNKLLGSKYNEHTMKMFEIYIEHKDIIYSPEKIMGFYDTYMEQLNLYTKNIDLDYKPFSILKMVHNDGNETIPLIDHSLSQSQMFKMLNDDEQLIFNMNKNTIDEKYIIIKNYFDSQVNNNYEGIIIKSEYVAYSKDIKSQTEQICLPMIKCRNPKYLSIIYGPDYKEPIKYNKLIQNKKISRKLNLSICEFQIGMEMLGIKYDNIGNEDYNKILTKFIKLENEEKTIDVRL